MRLFVAVDLGAEVKESLESAVAPLRETLPPARWVRPEGFHLTLAFLGEVAAGRVPAIAQALRGKLERAGGFRAHFGALGTFPNAGPVRIVWVGLEPSVRFVRLAELAEDGLREAGVALDDKPFRSHVTLARCDPAWPSNLRNAIGESTAGIGERLAGVSFACERVTLFSSLLGKSGPTHRVEQSFPLQSP